MARATTTATILRGRAHERTRAQAQPRSQALTQTHGTAYAEYRAVNRMRSLPYGRKKKRKPLGEVGGEGQRKVHAKLRRTKCVLCAHLGELHAAIATSTARMTHNVTFSVLRKTMIKNATPLRVLDLAMCVRSFCRGRQEGGNRDFLMREELMNAHREGQSRWRRATVGLCTKSS
jgi:hypothetical protein